MNRAELNDGAGVFTELAGQAQCYGWATLATLLVDLDRDGDLDIYVGNDLFYDCLYRNNGDGTFTDIAAEIGTDKSSISAMAASAGDIDNDGLIDLLVSDSTNGDESIGNAVFINRGDLTFENKGRKLGLSVFDSSLGSETMFAWGSGIFDFDLDGDNDVHMVTHVTVEEVFWQRTFKGFEIVNELTFRLLDVDGRGSAYGDIDNDGDIDIVVARRGDGAFIADPAPLQILRNDTDTPCKRIKIDVVPPHLAPGAHVTITMDTCGSQTQSLEVGSGYSSVNPSTAIFGLGAASRVESIKVEAIGRPPVIIEAPTEEHVVVNVGPEA
ncbi:MAG: CRTAC1 family protein [Myxococcales bacterium]|nr:CRTAC1 family protein [Myxococcales bacterium]